MLTFRKFKLFGHWFAVYSASNATYGITKGVFGTYFNFWKFRVLKYRESQSGY